MQSLLIEIVIAVLLFFLLWSMERGRSDLRFRFWVIGWALVTLRLISLLWHPISSIVLRLREGHFAAVEVFAAACFILSDRAVTRQKNRMIRTGVLAIVPALFTAFVILFRSSDLWLLYPCIVVAHVLAIMLLREYSGWRKTKLVPLAVLHFLSACWMLGALASHQPQLALACVPAELLLVNAVLFSRRYSLRSAGNLLAVVGFVLWAWSSFVTIAMQRLGTSDGLVPRTLNLPQFLIAIGMIMLILEQDAAGSRELVREYEFLFNNNPFPLWIYDTKTLRFLSVNAASAKVHGYTVEELSMKKLTDVVHPDIKLAAPRDPNAESVRIERPSRHVRKDGSTISMNVTAYDIRFRGRPARIALAEDISEREEMASQLMYQVQHDLLTGLPNRATFLRKLDETFIAANCNGTGCAVMVLHINRFERINENYGHGIGDGVLKEITKLLQTHLRPPDAIGRTGSREFTITFACAPNGHAIEARARGLLRLFDQPITVGEHRIDVSMSMGLAAFPEDSDDANSLLRDAARALALTKVRGAEKFVRLSRELSLQAQEESRIEGLIQRALLYSGFEVYYQPILDTDGTLHALEALLRLHDEDGRLISPGLFIPLAESTGTIIPVGRWIINEVCRQLQEWREAGLEIVPVAINVSALQIVQTTFAADLMAILSRFQIAPTLVHLELTESSVMPQGSLALDNMLKLAAKGIKFSIDDFGTGFSSLDRLHQLPVSILKIDQTFVMRMLDPDGTLPIVNTIISMAHSLNVGVVAEGVETKEQFHALYEMGCDLFQGYFFSRAVDALSAAAVLAREPGALMPIKAPPVVAPIVTMSPRPFPPSQSGSHLW
jgi:diguanylate cyclase (GGDEF)-like protein/PAS domain S-box-containing protein